MNIPDRSIMTQLKPWKLFLLSLVMTSTFLVQRKSPEKDVNKTTNIHVANREPTWIDAVIFSYLHSIMSYPTIPGSTLGDEEKKQAGELKTLVRKHENLVQYAKNIYEAWLK